MSPLLTDFAGVSIYALGFARGGVLDKFFIASGKTANTTYSTSVHINSANLITWTMFDQGSTHLWATITADGTFGTSYGYVGANWSVPMLNAKSDAAGNTFVSAAVSGVSQYQLQPAKTTGSSVTWTRKLGNVASYTSYGILDTDSSGNVYVTGLTTTMRTSSEVVLGKWNSSGTIQWQKYYTSPTWTYNRCDDISVSSSGNVYLAAAYNSTSTNASGVMKLDSSGAVSWQRVATALNPTAAGTKIASDSSDAVYAYIGEKLTKFDSSGTYQWANFISTSFIQYDVATDTAGNVYTVHGNGITIWLVKYNSSGTIQWQRSITSSSGALYLGSQYGQTRSIISATDTAVTIAASDNTNAVLFKLPTDGSLTGAYIVNATTYTYAASSLSPSSSTNSYSSHTVNMANLTATEAANSLSISTQTPTYAKKVIP